MSVSETVDLANGVCYSWNVIKDKAYDRGRQLCPELCGVPDMIFRIPLISAAPTNREFSKRETVSRFRLVLNVI